MTFERRIASYSAYQLRSNTIPLIYQKCRPHILPMQASWERFTLAITFGKRIAGIATPAAPPKLLQATPDTDCVTRVIPKATWDGPHGATLRKYGFSPDDTANLALTPERMRALEIAALDRMNALVAKVNAHIPGISLVPWAMIPWAVWKDRNALFLMKAEFFPSSPWNNMLLAADAKSSIHLGVPEHPRTPIPELNDNLTRLIDELRANFADEIDRNEVALSRGDFSVLARHQALSKDRFQKLFALTRHVANLVWGDAVCARHDQLFGIGLKSVTG
jgi:hypothetical protein